MKRECNSNSNLNSKTTLITDRSHYLSTENSTHRSNKSSNYYSYHSNNSYRSNYFDSYRSNKNCSTYRNNIETRQRRYNVRKPKTSRLKEPERRENIEDCYNEYLSLTEHIEGEYNQEMIGVMTSELEKKFQDMSEYICTLDYDLKMMMYDRIFPRYMAQSHFEEHKFKTHYYVALRNLEEQGRITYQRKQFYDDQYTISLVNFLNIEGDEVAKLKRVIKSLQLDKIKPVFRNIHNRLREVEGGTPEDKNRRDFTRTLLKQLVESQQFYIEDAEGEQLDDVAMLDQVADPNFIRVYVRQDPQALGYADVVIERPVRECSVYEPEDSLPLEQLDRKFLDQNVKLLILYYLRLLDLNKPNKRLNLVFLENKPIIRDKVALGRTALEGEVCKINGGRYVCAQMLKYFGAQHFKDIGDSGVDYTLGYMISLVQWLIDQGYLKYSGSFLVMHNLLDYYKRYFDMDRRITITEEDQHSN